MKPRIHDLVKISTEDVWFKVYTCLRLRNHAYLSLKFVREYKPSFGWKHSMRKIKISVFILNSINKV